MLTTSRSVWIDENLMSPDSTGDGTVGTYEDRDAERVYVNGTTLLRMVRWSREAGLLDDGPDDDANACAVALSPEVGPADSPLYDVTDAFGGWDNYTVMKEGLEA